MQSIWTFNEAELKTLLSIFHETEIYGIELSDSRPDAEKCMKSLEEKGLLKDQDGKKRLADALEVSLITMLDKQVGISMQMEGEKENLCNLYLHGETIVYLRKMADADYEIRWIPFLPMALGGVYDFYKTNLTLGPDEATMQYTMESVFEDFVFGRLRKAGNVIWCMGDAAEGELTEASAEDAFVSIQKLIVFSHSKCMKSFLDQQEASSDAAE